MEEAAGGGTANIFADYSGLPLPVISPSLFHTASSIIRSVDSGPNKGRFTHSTPCPCRAHAVPLPCSDSVMSFVKVRVVAGNIRTASSTV